MRKLFELEAEWARTAAPTATCAAADRRRARSSTTSSTWATEQYARVKDTRGLVATAFGYAVRQAPALRRFLDDGTTAHDQQPLRARLASHRRGKARMAVLRLRRPRQRCRQPPLAHRLRASFIGSTPRPTSPRSFTVLPYWPRDRYLELAPKYWAATRARIPAAQLDVEIGDITVPPPMPTKEQPPTR